MHAAATCMSSADTESDIEEYNDEIDYTYASAEESTESENNFDGNPEESSNRVRSGMYSFLNVSM